MGAEEVAKAVVTEESDTLTGLLAMDEEHWGVAGGTKGLLGLGGCVRLWGQQVCMLDVLPSMMTEQSAGMPA